MREHQILNLYTITSNIVLYLILIQSSYQTTPPQKCENQLSSWCMQQQDCVSSLKKQHCDVSNLYARFDKPNTPQQRCYSSSSLDHQKQQYSGGTCFCTRDALNQLVKNCQQSIFTNGENGYYCYRIPSIIKLANKDLIVFSEARKLSCNDHGWVDIVQKRSTDNGLTWGDFKIVHSESNETKQDTIGNASPVVLKSSGKIILVFTKNNQQVFTLMSDDSGNSWKNLTDITNQVTHKGQNWIATGPPQGIQLQNGRIYISCDYTILNSIPYSFGMYSDDEGLSWKTSNHIEGGNECQSSQCKNGTLVMNMRTMIKKRQFSWSENQGETWSPPIFTPFKFEVGNNVEGSTISMENERDVLFFSFPSSVKGRYNMSIFKSTDCGLNWELFEVIDQESSAYSALVQIDDINLGLVYESSDYAAITYKTINLKEKQVFNNDKSQNIEIRLMNQRSMQNKK